MTKSVPRIKLLVILTELSRNGAVLSTLTTLRHLDKTKFEAKLFVIKRTTVRAGDDAWNTLLADVDLTYGVRSGKKLPFNAPVMLFTLFKLSKRSDIIIGGLEMGPSFLAALMGKLTRKPAIGFVRNSLPEILNQLPRNYSGLTKLFYPALTRVVAISNGIKLSVEKLIPKLIGRVTTVYIPLNLEQIRKKSVQLLPEAEEHKPYILAAGRLVPQKGFDILLHAYAGAREKGVDQKLIIVGEGRERENLEYLIKKLGLSAHVVLTGFQKNPFGWMKHATILVSSSRFEGFCRVIAESLAVGTPVVSTDCPNGPSEVLDGGNCGILVENENVKALEQGIVELINNPARCAKFSELGKLQVENFSASNTVSKFENLLFDVLGGKRQVAARQEELVAKP